MEPRDVKYANWVEIGDIKIGWNKNRVESWPAQIYFGSNGLKIGLGHEPLISNILLFTFYYTIKFSTQEDEKKKLQMDR